MTRYLVWQCLNPTAKPPCCEGVGGFICVVIQSGKAIISIDLTDMPDLQLEIFAIRQLHDSTPSQGIGSI
ncbi:hypothetical protein CEXT_454471 [Caerostris extrusa]|uniref:Uncharacterized protein n=1 Tax=Caerostris extrusa TaxID=172846 RepID=A0AAV4M3N2_CAEEX|nr:hypothetical protein CEXT_454471 [Caerostris extrusa]